jgi:2,3,4,5-tetrahydropyridine-2-carboxylate N-succinyltransferase
LTASTKIIDVTGETPVEMKGFVPARSVVIPGSYQEISSWRFSGSMRYNHWNTQSTDLKTSLNNALREYDVAV